MKPNWTDRQLSHHLRRLSTTPPNTSFEQRLSLSLGLAADEIRASRMPPVPAPRTRKRTYLRAALLLGLALGVAAAASQVWLRQHAATRLAAEPGD
jgi:hypothetical protein